MSVALISADLRAATRSLQDLVLQCRPLSVVAFAARYFRDERQVAQASYLHALHALPFLLQRPNEFRAAACTVYCAIRSSKDKGKERSAGCDKADMSEVLRASVYGSSTSSTRDKGKMDAEWELDVVEEALKELMSALESFDFDAFVVVLRLHLSAYLAVQWVVHKLAEKESFADAQASVKKYKSPTYFEQVSHPLRREHLAAEDAQLFFKLLGNALPVNQDTKQLCLHCVRGYLSAMETPPIP